MRALITGVTGQDGSYLAQHLERDGYTIFGLVHGQSHERRRWISDLVPKINLVEGDLLDEASLVRAIAESQPDEIYNLAAISAPAVGWSQPTLTAEVTGLGVLRLLEAMRFVVPNARFIQASSIALHGPYGAAKTFADDIVTDYRKRGMHVSSIVMGGHHSPRRGLEFFTRKVTRAVAEIHRDRRDTIKLGPLGRSQDWGWADDFVLAMHEVMQRAPGRYVVSTGEPHTAQEWVELAFAAVGRDWRDHVTYDISFGQPTDVATLTATTDDRLAWKPRQDFAQLIDTMVHADLEDIDG